ncbi:MAG: GNAT family N-acetyltransferase [Acidimicrobiales bacterium]|nr:GNAT family N-acetyltransferase [Acidimicrobiales bacterium]
MHPSVTPSLHGRRVVLRPLVAEDFPAWREVRRRNVEWLTKWEPRRPAGSPDVIEDRHAFSVRCSTRERERQLGTAFGFGVFVDGALCGEMNINSIQRGPFQNCYVGYWMDEAQAGNGYTPEALVVAMQFAFDQLRLHRVQVAIIPRNGPSNRVVAKVGIRSEGVAVRYLEINGQWEDHTRYAMTAEEWAERRDELMAAWIV